MAIKTDKNRDLVTTLKSRISEDAPLIQVVIGPRQIGKTTALKAALNKEGIYKTADYPTPLSSDILTEWWEEAEADSSRLLAVDEIQKVTDWSEAIKFLWDKTKDFKLILTGSSSLLVEKGLKETLAGRYELIRAEHWNFKEASKVFDLSIREYIEFGCYPGAAVFLKDIQRWASYIRDSIVEPAIGRDLLQLHPIENPALLRQIFGAAIAVPAHLLSTQKMQGSLQEKGSVPTIRHYLSLLSEAFLISGLDKYSPFQLRSRSSIPKFIVHDNGLCRAFERPVSNSISNERFGWYFENSVGARFIEAGWDVYYWKHRKLEVDFIVHGPNDEKWAIEVKSGKTSISELKGLYEFCELYPDFEPCLISLVGQEFDGIKSLDPDEVLSLTRGG